MDKRLSVLVVTCDKYSDLWDPFFKLFKKFWSDCPNDVYLGTNNKIYDNPSVKTICIGGDKSWCENVKSMITQIPSDRILLLLEDFFLEETVNTNNVNKALQYAIDNDIDCLRVCPNPPPQTITYKELNIGLVKRNAPYYISTQPSIWKKDALAYLLKDGYSAWDFEKKNTADTNLKELKIYSSKDFIIKRHNGVERGKYYTSTIKLLEENGIQVDPSKRGVIDDMSLSKRVYAKLYSLRRTLLSK